MKTNIGILIQGPIISRGRNFLSSVQKDFKTEIYINNLYKIAQKNNCELILTTWNDQDASNVEIPGKDIFKFQANLVELCPNLLNNRNSSKYKQFYLIKEGIEILRKRECDVVIKLRTDQFLDLQMLIDHINHTEANLGTKIMTLFADSRTIDSWVDFLFVAKIDSLVSNIDSFINQKEIFSSIHRDFFYHMHRKNLSFFQSIVFRLFLPYDAKNFSKKQIYLIKEIWIRNFILMPLGVLESLEWRGSRFDLNSLRTFFYGYENYLDFLEELDNLLWSSPRLSHNFLSLDVLTVFLPGSFADNCRRVLSSLKRRIRR